MNGFSPVARLALLSMLFVLGQRPIAAQDGRVSQQEIQQAVMQLGDSRYLVREKATRYLWQVGSAAESAVRTACQSEDAEVAFRARSLLEKLQFGIFPDTPADVVQLIEQYRDGNTSKKHDAVRKLYARREIRTMLALLRSEPNESLRREFQRRYLGEIQSVVPQLLVDGEFSQAEEVLELGAVQESGIRYYALFLLLTERIDDKIDIIEQRLKSSPTPLDHQLLTYLHRAAGDLQNAQRHAKQAGLLDNILLESRQWQELSSRKPIANLKSAAKPKQTDIDPFNDDPFGKDPFSGKSEPDYGRYVEQLGFAAAYARLAKDEKQFAEIVKQQQSVLATAPGQAWHCAEALLINDQVDSAIELLSKHRPAVAFELLCSQCKFAEAFQLAGIEDPTANHEDWFASVADKIRSNPQPELKEFELAIQVARTLHSLGHRDQSERYFQQLADAVKDDAADDRLRALCEMENRLGLTTPAFEHGGIILSRQQRPFALNTFFPSNALAAEAWWQYYREIHHEEKPSETLRRLHRLLRPRPGEQLSSLKLERLIEDVEATRKTLKLPFQFDWQDALAKVCQEHGNREMAMQLYDKAALANNIWAFVRLGDLHAETESWSAAATAYEEAFQRGPRHSIRPLALYLHGHALVQAGQQKTGKRQMQLATLLPLAASQRSVLAQGIQQRGHLAEARRQWELILRCGPFNGRSVRDAARNLGDLTVAEDPLAAADHWETRLLQILQHRLTFVQPRGYLSIPEQVHRARTKGLLRKGETAAALKELWSAHAALPGHVPLTVELVPELTKAGQDEVANRLFNQTYETLEKVVERFPSSARYLNDLAWLCARCDRKLDKALSYAQRAVKLEPQKPAYLDTLAEVHFRRGENDEAAKLARQCLELDPDNEHFQQQLKRVTSAAKR